jgi:hypothetical protein
MRSKRYRKSCPEKSFVFSSSDLSHPVAVPDQNNDNASRETVVELPVHFSPIFLYSLFLEIAAAAHQRRQQPGV